MNRLEQRLEEIDMLLAYGIEDNDPQTAKQLKKEKEDILKELKKHGDI